jgi:hypothetical protein
MLLRLALHLQHLAKLLLLQKPHDAVNNQLHVLFVAAPTHLCQERGTGR